MLYGQQVLFDKYSLAHGKETLRASFLLGAGTPLNYYLDSISLEEVKPFDHPLILGLGVSVRLISFWLVKEVIDCCVHLHAEADRRKKQQVWLLRSCLWLIYFRDQVLEIIPSHEEQIRTLLQLEAEEHLEVFVIPSTFLPT